MNRRRELMLKQLDREKQLYDLEYMRGPLSYKEKAIIHLERIILSVAPYGRWWRYGYIRSLRLAIKSLREDLKQ